ncbi:hypothetical protein F2Q69_00058321 [Brassica cretica]|uniref:PPM-type phosphatase domain-containing protein n=1 Tax=Brassica cretica TaxID=69181 RepID=A0A8S9RQ71_BRACR|nr:hypothetical protein F2Q69_00058321 [Brassica cretica]
MVERTICEDSVLNHRNKLPWMKRQLTNRQEQVAIDIIMNVPPWTNRRNEITTVDMSLRYGCDPCVDGMGESACCTDRCGRHRSFSHGLALRVGSKRRSLVRILRGAISKTVSRRQNSVVAPIRTEKNLKEGTLNDDVSVESQSLQWAQGKAGEDRVHVVVSEEHGWLFVGIYDGFNGPDAPDYLLSHLYPTLHRELKDLLLWNGPHNHCDRRWRCEWDQEKQDLGRRLKEQIKHRTGSGSDRLTDHNEVLHALSEALRKTEEAYLDTADKMLEENPELALMGSCVLVMLMKGEDVYVMNVGDSRAVLGQRLERINEETMIKGCEGHPGLSASQLTVDHSTNVEEVSERTMAFVAQCI